MAYSLQEAVSILQPPRVVWLMLPAGEVVDVHLRELLPELEEGDVVRAHSGHGVREFPIQSEWDRDESPRPCRTA